GNYNRYQANLKLKEIFPELLKEHTTQVERLREEEVNLKKTLEKTEILKNDFDRETFEKIKLQYEEKTRKEAGLRERIRLLAEKLKDISLKIHAMKETEAELERATNDLTIINRIDEFSKQIRMWFKNATPMITEALLENINFHATEIIQDLLEDESVEIMWKNNYDVFVRMPQMKKSFLQLSGGEQMAVALSIRLALLRVLTSIDFAFFDEPTANLDPTRRENLANSIKRVKGFKQLFVISHDDTFEGKADNIITFKKDERNISRVEFV
ncbi:MAG: hypothetical protein ACTSUE_10875, partial [Promethearchaeota archaeon]